MHGKQAWRASNASECRKQVHVQQAGTAKKYVGACTEPGRTTSTTGKRCKQAGAPQSGTEEAPQACATSPSDDQVQQAGTASKKCKGLPRTGATSRKQASTTRKRVSQAGTTSRCPQRTDICTTSRQALQASGPPRTLAYQAGTAGRRGSPLSGP